MVKISARSAAPSLRAGYRQKRGGGTLKLMGNRYPNATRVYRFLLTLPVTVATNERSFSKLKLVKNKLRSTLTNDKMEWLILCSVEKDLLENNNLSNFSEDWSRLKNRRVKIVPNL